MMKALKTFLIIIMGILGVTSCSKMEDPVKPFVEGGEIIYSTKVDSLVGHSGENRAILNWRLPVNHSMKTAWAFWNNNKDSAELRYNVIDDKWYTATLIDLDEATYLFDVYTLDNDGNKSIKTLVSVNVYGEKYQSTLLNRSFVSAIADDNGDVVVQLSAAEETEVETKIFYTDKSNINKVLKLTRTQNNFTINNWKEGTKISFVSRFKPTKSAIDTVDVLEKSDMIIKKDVTAEYLKNYKQPFLSIQNTNRFRDPLDWIINTSVQNQSGQGGWSTDDGTVLAMESGWGAANITNGKLYQTVTLPKGNYGIEIGLGGNGIASSKVKIVAVAGNSIPDFTADFQVSDALGTADLQHKQLRFSNPADSKVSIGFLANMVGDQYWRVNKVSLFRYY